MDNKYTAEGKLFQKTKVRHAIYYFHYMFWVAFYVLGGAMTYRSYLYLSANTANDGTYPTNFEVLCILILAISVVTVVSLAQMFSNVYDTGKFNELVGATQFHGFLGLQTTYMEMEFPFICRNLFLHWCNLRPDLQRYLPVPSTWNIRGIFLPTRNLPVKEPRYIRILLRVC
jgi:hypothetical protein